MSDRVQFAVRAVFLTILVTSTVVVGHAAVTSGQTAAAAAPPPITGEYDRRVAATAHGDTATSKIVVYGSDGTVEYLNATHDRYFDVDPHPSERDTLTYVAADHVYGPPCGADAQCSRNVIERVNITTGETEVLFERFRPSVFEARWHDADRLGPNRWVIADIAFDRVMIVNTTSGETEWAWNAQEHFPLSGGGTYPDDWTHINDVEVVRDGLIMVSVRNQDSVVFLDPGRGVVENLTLGADDNHEILNEQHNPDYIPRENGGPALLVGDSHNNRVVEYQRRDGEWRQSWSWTDARMSWPRDADRLPNGNTLVTDSNGNRLMMIGENGSILWSTTIDTPYEAEALGTGDESSNGSAAAMLGLTTTRGDRAATSRGGGDGSVLLGLLITIRGVLPSIVVNAVLYVLPTWVHITELIMIAVGTVTALTWTVVEYRWSSVEFGLRLPLDISR